jgi:hypothetical protein
VYSYRVFGFELRRLIIAGSLQPPTATNFADLTRGDETAMMDQLKASTFTCPSTALQASSNQLAFRCTCKGITGKASMASISTASDGGEVFPVSDLNKEQHLLL